MKIKSPALLCCLSLAALVLCGCDDSKVPLSDPRTAQADDRLLGLWKVRDEHGDVSEYYHVGNVPEAPEGLLRVVGVSHSKSGKIDVEDYLVFTTKLGDKTYLNVTGGGRDGIKQLKENGWQPADDAVFFLFRYQVDGDTITVAGVDEQAKKTAIESGRIKGEIGAQSSRFTDTTENLAHFIQSAGDSLFSKEPGRLDRVK